MKTKDDSRSIMYITRSNDYFDEEGNNEGILNLMGNLLSKKVYRFFFLKKAAGFPFVNLERPIESFCLALFQGSILGPDLFRFRFNSSAPAPRSVPLISRFLEYISAFSEFTVFGKEPYCIAWEEDDWFSRTTT